MPILKLEIVGALPPGRRQGLAQVVADAAGGILGSRERGTWVRVHDLPEEDYAENGGAEAGVRPIFVTLLKYERAEGEALARETARLTEAIARACGRPAENVHLLHLPAARGRMAFGGEVVA